VALQLTQNLDSHLYDYKKEFDYDLLAVNFPLELTLTEVVDKSSNQIPTPSAADSNGLASKRKYELR
jgi:hypothetical protein